MRQQLRYRIESASDGDVPGDWFDSADEAMKAVNRLRALRSPELVILDDTGAVLTDRQLAMLVMERRLEAPQVSTR